MKDLVVNFIKDEEGMETLEIVILLVVLVGIAFAFRKTLVGWFNSFLQDTEAQSKGFGTIETGKGFE